MEYVINLIKTALAEENRHLLSAEEGAKYTTSSVDLEAFRESMRLARLRIPQLQKALVRLTVK